MMLEPTPLPTPATPRAVAGLKHDSTCRLPYLESEGALYGEVFLLAIRDAGSPWPRPGVNDYFAKRRAIVDGMRFLFDPADERRYLVGRMAGMSRATVDYVVRSLRSEHARGAYNSGLRPHHLSVVRDRAARYFPDSGNPASTGVDVTTLTHVADATLAQEPMHQ